MSTHRYAAAAVALALSFPLAGATVLAEDAMKPAGAQVEHKVKDSGDAAVVKALKDQEKKFVDALSQGKAEPLGEMLADDYAATDPIGHVAGKQALMSFLGRGTFKVDSAELSDVTASAQGDTGVVRATLQLKGKWEEKDISGEYRMTNTWVRRDGNWTLLAGHISRVRPNAAAAD